MAIKSYVNGAGGTTGADLAILDNVLVSGKILYLGNAVAGASDANTGLERNKPLLTLLQAYTNASANDTIVILASHAETISVALVASKAGVNYVGEGTGTTVPRFTCGGAIVMIDVTGSCVYFDNILFTASTAVPTAVLRFSGSSCTGNALQFECGANDTNRMLSFNAAGNSVMELKNSSFTAVAAGAAVGFEIQASTTALVMDRVTFDGGSFGWTGYAWKASVAAFSMRVTRLNLLNGSDVLLPTTSNGFIQVAAVTGDSRIDWTA